MTEILKAHFHSWCNAVVCLCFQTALLLNNALWLAIYFYRLAFSTGKLIGHSKLRVRCLGWFLDRIVLIVLEIGISYSWEWMNPLPTMNPSKETFTCRWSIQKNVKTLKPPREVGDKSTCKTFIHCRIHWRNICLCCYLSNEINIFILDLSCTSLGLSCCRSALFMQWCVCT